MKCTYQSKDQMEIEPKIKCKFGKKNENNNNNNNYELS